MSKNMKSIGKDIRYVAKTFYDGEDKFIAFGTLDDGSATLTNDITLALKSIDKDVMKIIVKQCDKEYEYCGLTSNDFVIYPVEVLYRIECND